MTAPSPLTQSSTPPMTARPPGGPASHLRQEYESWQTRFEAQAAIVQRFLETQARTPPRALTQRDPPTQVRFTLPDRVLVEAGGQEQPVPPDFRQQLAGGLMDRPTRAGRDSSRRPRP